MIAMFSRGLSAMFASETAVQDVLVVALGAAISCFGALNGWVLIAGQFPMAIAKDGLFPPLFGRLSARGTPTLGMIVGGVLGSDDTRLR